MGSAGQNRNPFYMQITPVLEKFTDSAGKAASIDLPLVTLPPGTVLFRGMRIPNPASVDVRMFYRDFLGDPEGKRNLCMTPTHNVFFYPFPYVAFGVNDVGKEYDMMQMVVLVHPVTVVSMISPSPWVRGIVKRYSGTAPIQRCSSPSFPIACHPLSEKEKEALSWDNCLHPDYQVKSGTRGWMALGNMDSFNPKGKVAKQSSMSTYIRDLESRQPGLGPTLAAWSYTDANKSHGFPEIALYPYKNHQGNTLLKRTCPTVDIAVRMMQKEAEADNLNYFPLATFTKQGTVDMVSGLFTQERLGLSANSMGSSRETQSTIETKLHEYMDKLQAKGIILPHFGPGKLSLDTRTGFFVLPQVIPRGLTIPLPADSGVFTPAPAPAGAVAGPGPGANKPTLTQPYRYAALPLETEEDRKRALNYMLIFRNHIPARFMEKYGLDKGIGIRRAMVFDRPPVLPRIFDELGLEVPASFRNGIGRASALFQKNTAPQDKKKPVGKPVTPSSVGVKALTEQEMLQKNIESFPAIPLNAEPAYSPPAFVPPAGVKTPAFVPPAYQAGVKTPAASPAAQALPPWMTPSAQKQKQRKSRKQPRKQFGGKKTRKLYVRKSIHDLAKMFDRVWASHRA